MRFLLRSLVLTNHVIDTRLEPAVISAIAYRCRCIRIGLRLIDEGSLLIARRTETEVIVSLLLGL